MNRITKTTGANVQMRHLLPQADGGRGGDAVARRSGARSGVSRHRLGAELARGVPLATGIPLLKVSSREKAWAAG